MNSKIIKGGALLTLGLIANSNGVQAIDLTHKHQIKSHSDSHQQGIFESMIDQALAPQRLAQEKSVLKERKKKQLEDAQKQYEKDVAEEEAEEYSKKKKIEDEAEKQALEAAQNSPQAQMLAAANEAASNINVSAMEATIQAQLQAKIDSGASKADLLASVGDDTAIALANPAISLAQPVMHAVVQPAISLAVQPNPQVSAIMAQVLAKKGIKTKSAPHVIAPVPIEQPAMMVMAKAQNMAPKVSVPVVPEVTTVQVKQVASVSSTSAAEVKASQEKVKEMAAKLGVPFTADLMAMSGGNSAISDVLIEKAVAAGKSEQEINEAMAAL